MGRRARRISPGGRYPPNNAAPPSISPSAIRLPSLWSRAYSFMHRSLARSPSEPLRRSARNKETKSNESIEQSPLDPRCITYFLGISVLVALFKFLPRNPSQEEDDAQAQRRHQQVEVLPPPDAKPIIVVYTKIICE